MKKRTALLPLFFLLNMMCLTGCLRTSRHKHYGIMNQKSQKIGLGLEPSKQVELSQRRVKKVSLAYFCKLACGSMKDQVIWEGCLHECRESQVWLRIGGPINSRQLDEDENSIGWPDDENEKKSGQKRFYIKNVNSMDNECERKRRKDVASPWDQPESFQESESEDDRITASKSTSRENLFDEETYQQFCQRQKSESSPKRYHRFQRKKRRKRRPRRDFHEVNVEDSWDGYSGGEIRRATWKKAEGSYWRFEPDSGYIGLASKGSKQAEREISSKGSNDCKKGAKTAKTASSCSSQRGGLKGSGESIFSLNQSKLYEAVAKLLNLYLKRIKEGKGEGYQRLKISKSDLNLLNSLLKKILIIDELQLSDSDQLKRHSKKFEPRDKIEEPGLRGRQRESKVSARRLKTVALLF